MSFGFSVGDFIAVGKLVFEITDSLRGSSEEYQELVRELEGLARALDHVDRLKGSPSQADAVNRIKCAALSCRHPLEKFRQKIQKFDRSLGTGKSNGKLKDAGKKMQWAFGPGRKDEINKLRNYLHVHIEIVNLQMIQQGFEAMRLDMDEASAEQEALKGSVESSAQELKDIRGDLQAQTLIVKEHGSVVRTLANMVVGEVIAPLTALTNMVSKVFTSTQQVYNILIEVRTNLRGLDTRFTYLQPPVKVEDVLGRSFAFPSEFSVSALQAEIVSRFKEGPGRLEVAAGDYEIFNAKDTNDTLDADSDSILLPAMSIHMAVYREKDEKTDACPTFRCKSTEATAAPGGGKVCAECNVWFEETSKKRKRRSDDQHICPLLELPFKENSQEHIRKDGGIFQEQSHNSDRRFDSFKRIKVVQKPWIKTFKELIREAPTYQCLMTSLQVQSSLVMNPWEQVRLQHGSKDEHQPIFAGPGPHLFPGPLSRDCLIQHYPDVFSRHVAHKSPPVSPATISPSGVVLEYNEEHDEDNKLPLFDFSTSMSGEKSQNRQQVKLIPVN